MDNQNITMEEYIRLEEEKARRHGKVYSWETAKYVFNDELSSEKTLSCEPTVSSLNNNDIDFRISFDESDNEDYTPTISCFDDLDFFKDFENEFPAIVYNDALMSKSDFLTKPTLSPQHIDEFDLKDETSFSEYDEVEQNILYFNDLFPFNIIYPDNLKSDKDNDDNETDIRQSSGGTVNTQGSKKFLEASHDKINKIFIMESFVMELDANIMAWNYLNNRMLLNLIKNLYVPFGIPFDPKWKIGLQERIRRIRIGSEMRLDAADTLCFQLGGARCSMTWRQFILALGLHISEEIAEDGFEAYWDFLRAAPSYTYIRDPLRRLYHRHAEVRKSGARLLGGHLIRHLAHHFGLVSDDGLKGLSVMTRELPLIDMVAVAAALGGTEVSLYVDEGAQAVSAPVHAPRPPPPVGGRNIPHEEEIHGLCQDVRSLCGLVERSMTDQGRFSIWMISCMTQLMEANGCTYQAFNGTFQGSYPVVFERRTRQWIDDASTSTAQQDEQQPDP
ncbi:hypothetical protein Tco_0868734 [Tanacetum coccineum]